MGLRPIPFIGAFVFLAAFALFDVPESRAASHSDHYLLNATSGTVVLNEVFAARHTINYKLERGYSFVFDGILMRLEVRMPNGQTLIYSERQLRKLHGNSTPNRGYWLLGDRGLRLVSAAEYVTAYRKLHHRP